jgi:hypothetical protein
MKRKKAGRKTRKKPPAIPARPLRDLGGKALNALPFGAIGPNQTEISGVPLPPDLEPAARHYARLEFSYLEHLLICPPWGGDPAGQDDFPGWKEADIPPEGWHDIRRSLEECFRQGFFLALLRYADDLKRSAEAAPLLEGLREAANKGAAARRKQAEPLRKAVCKRFRELRKTVPKKTVRYLKIAGELGISDRHVARIVNEADLD